MSLISIGLSGLNASSAAMTTIGNNTANVDTLGYSRQQVMTTASAQQNIGVGFIGTGTTLSDVRRIYNSYLDTQLQTSTSLDSDAQAYLGQASKLDSLLSSSSTGISSVLSTFFNNLQALSNKPTDSAARTNFLTSASALSAQFNSISSQMKDQNANINTQMSAVAGQVNSLAASIADMNKQITQTQALGGQPNTLLDARNEAVRQLNGLVGAKVVETNGNYDVYIGTGQPLVTGTQANTLSAVPSDTDPTAFALKLNYQNSNVDVSSVVSGGTLGGLLRYRSDVLQPAASELGRMAVVVTDQVNQQLNQGVDANGQFGANLFKDINDPSLTIQRSIGNKNNDQNSGILAVNITNTGVLSTGNYSVTFGPGAAGTAASTYTVRAADGSSLGPYNIADPAPATLTDKLGFSLSFNNSSNGTVPPGTFKVGDSFQVSPTRTGAEGIKTVMTDPKSIAAAAPLTGTAGASNTGTGSFTQPTLSTPVTADVRSAINATMPIRLKMGAVAADGSQSYQVFDAKGNEIIATDGSGNPVTRTITAGATNSIQLKLTDTAGTGQSYEIDMSISGHPVAGDTYSIALTGAGSSDNRNAESTLGLQTKQTIGNSADNGTGTSISGANSNMITAVGSKASQAKDDATATTAVLTQAKSARDSVSGVSLDEEAANLVKYQQYYTASSQIIKAAQAIFSTLINSL
ncbi:flagellar hook-associated protein FlgK [Pseudomonas sp. RC10]|uniref:flagellar hook-associated protein FlgK n=1 Tax=Pseudomonas bambusae TaxID=3139142 RepID=UPI003139553D